MTLAHSPLAEEWLKHVEFHSGGSQDYSAVSHGFDDATILPPPIKPEVYKVSIEEIGGDLRAGAVTKPLKRPEPPPPSKFYYQTRQPQENCYCDLGEADGEGAHTITVETEVRFSELRDAPAVWIPFNHTGLEVFEGYGSHIEGVSARADRCVQVYRVKPLSKTQAPYIQFYCSANVCRYGGVFYSRGDVMTLFVNANHPPEYPSPPMVAVVPQAAQSFVRLRTGQMLQVITEQEAEIEWDFRDRDDIKYAGHSHLGEGTPEAGRFQADYFRCREQPQFQQTIYVHHPSLPLRAVILPYEDDEAYPIIFNPVSEKVVVYGCNVDGFVLKFLKENYLPVKYESTCIRSYFKSDSDIAEEKVKIITPRQYFTVIKSQSNWTIR